MRLKDGWVVIVTGLFASFLASIPLLDLRNIFAVDWNNHLWLIEYFGESIKHLKVPDVLNTQQLVGIPTTLFYAQKFYVIMGLFSAFLGSAIVVRVMVFLVFLLQFYQVYRAASKTGSHRHTSICIAIIVTWAIYPLTNLYNRSALTEFFAVAFLTCSLASFLCVILNPKDRVSRYDIVAMGLYFVIAATTHPLTALFGGLFMGILGIITLFFCEKSRRLWFMAYFTITAILSILILSPWAYFLHLFKDKIYLGSPIDSEACFLGGGFFPNSIDNVLSRLSLVPIDFRSIKKGLDVSTPYLDAQIMMPLLIIMGVFFYIGRRDKVKKAQLNMFERAIILASALILFIALAESFFPNILMWWVSFFDILQFPYRLTSYINLSILAILIVFAGRKSMANVNNQQIINLCLAFCIGISFSSLVLKLDHAAAIKQKSTKINEAYWSPLPFRSTRHLNELPWTFYAAEPYSVTDGFAKNTLPGVFPVIFRDFNVLNGKKFGQLEAMTVNLTEPTLVITNVQPFPWNQIVVNKMPQVQSQIFIVGKREAVFLPKGGSYLLNVKTNSDGIYKFLNILSWLLLLGWIALYMVVVFDKLAGNGGHCFFKEKCL